MKFNTSRAVIAASFACLAALAAPCAQAQISDGVIKIGALTLSQDATVTGGSTYQWTKVSGSGIVCQS